MTFDAGNAYEFPRPSFAYPQVAPTSEPSDDPLTSVCFNTDWLPFVLGALDQLCQASTWQGATGDIRLAIARSMTLKDIVAHPTCEVETPYWDDAMDVGESQPADEQVWYGEVTNPTAPPAELDFVENIAVWTFTGLLALATPEIGFAPAILFHTIAPKFIVAQKRGDIATIIDIFVNGEQQAHVDTTANAPDDIIQIPVVPATSESGYDLLVMNTLP